MKAAQYVRNHPNEVCPAKWEEGEETLTVDKLGEEHSPIIKLVDTTLFTAVQKRASDIHIEPYEKSFRVPGSIGRQRARRSSTVCSTRI